MPLPGNMVGIDGFVAYEISHWETQTENNQDQQIQYSASLANIFPESIERKNIELAGKR